MKKQFLVLALTISMCFSAAPVSVLADSPDSGDDSFAETPAAAPEVFEEVTFSLEGDDSEDAGASDTEDGAEIVAADDASDLTDEADEEDAAVGEAVDAEDDASVLLEDADADDEPGEYTQDEDGIALFSETVDEEEQEEDLSEAASDYVFVAEYLGGAWQAGSGELLSAEDFTVSVYDADGELVDTAEAESVSSDYEVDGDGYILALVVCVYGGENITVETKIMAIRTLAGDEEAFAVYSADDNSLTFYYGEVPEKGSDYHGKIVTSVYTGMDTATYNTQQATPWYEVDESVTNVSFDESFGVVQPVSTAFWFKGFLNCISFDLTNLDTSQVTTMNSMFCDCESLERLDLSGLDVTNVTTMRAVVCDCHSLTDVNVSGMVTGKVTLIQSFFYDCYKLTSLDLTDWDTSGVDDMSKVFENCYSLESVNVSNWDTSNATNMWKMFVNCESLTGLDLTSFNTKKVETYEAYEAFLSGCTSLQWISIGDDFDLFEKTTEPLVSEQYWYNSTTGEQVSDNYMIGVRGAGTYEVHDADISVFAVYSADDRSLTLYKDADGRPKKGDTYNDKTVTDVFIGFEEMHYEADYVLWSNYREDILQVVVDESFQEVVPRFTAYWFYDFSNCTSFDLTYLDTSRETDMGEMFCGCSSVTELDLSSFDTSNVTSMEYMFTDCISLQGLDLSSFNTSNVTAYTGFLSDCTGLRWITISEDFDLFEKSEEALVAEPKWYGKDTYTLVSDNYMIGFRGSGTYEVHEDDLAVFAVYSADDHSLTFYKDEENGIPAKGEIYRGKTVTEVYLGFDGLRYSEDTDVPWHAQRGDVVSVAADESFQEVTPVSTAYWFYYFTKCTSFDLGYLNTSNVTDMQSMFYNCASAASLDLSTFDTSNVTTTHCMFRDCKSLTEIDVGSFNTESMTDMSQMFHTCSGLTELDLSHFNTSSLDTMANMFSGCSSLETLNLRGWDTSTTTKMATEFLNCSSLMTIFVNEGDFDLDHHSLTNDSNMFSGCVSILGQNGTTYDSSDLTHTKAHIDTADNPGYLTNYAMFAVYCAEDGSLTFYADQSFPKVGEEYNGKTVTALYKGAVNTLEEEPSWEEIKEEVVTAACDESIADLQPKSFYEWFSGMTNCTGLDLTYLDTTTATAYTDMMADMDSLEWIKIGEGFDLFTQSETALVSQQYWYDANGKQVSDNYMIGINTAGTYYTDPCAVSHHYGDPTFTWSGNYSSCTATFTCEYGDSEVEVNCSVTVKEISPTCTEPGEITYTAACDFEGTTYSDEVDAEGAPATGHTWVESDVWINDTHMQITFTCSACGVKKTESVATEARSSSGLSGSVLIPRTDMPLAATLEQYEDGTEIEYILGLEDINDTVTLRDARLVENLLKDEGCLDDATIYYMDIVLTMHVISGDYEAEDTIAQTAYPVTITIRIPDELLTGEEGEYHVIRVHNGKAEDLPTTNNGDGTLTFETDCFSTYAVVFVAASEPEPTPEPGPADEKVNVSGTVHWDDDNDKADSRPDSVTIHLYADGEEIEMTTATAADGWNWSFTDLPKYAEDGHEIVYTVTEDAPEGYVVRVDGYEITDTLVSELPSGTGGTGGTDGNGSNPTGTISGQTGDTNVVPILSVIIIIAAAAAVVALVLQTTRRRIRR